MTEEQIGTLEGKTIRFLQDVNYCSVDDILDGSSDSPMINGVFADGTVNGEHEPTEEQLQAVIDELTRQGFVTDGEIIIKAGMEAVISGVVVDGCGACDVIIGNVCFEILAYDFTFEEPEEDEEIQISLVA